jgi:hypothetical protein
MCYLLHRKQEFSSGTHRIEAVLPVGVSLPYRLQWQHHCRWVESDGTRSDIRRRDMTTQNTGSHGGLPSAKIPSKYWSHPRPPQLIGHISNKNTTRDQQYFRVVVLMNKDVVLSIASRRCRRCCLNQLIAGFFAVNSVAALSTQTATQRRIYPSLWSGGST